MADVEHANVVTHSHVFYDYPLVPEGHVESCEFCHSARLLVKLVEMGFLRRLCQLAILSFFGFGRMKS